MAELEAAGFACQADVGENSWTKVFMARPAGMPLPETSLPSGWSIRPLAGEAEVGAYVALHRAVFESTSMIDKAGPEGRPCGQIEPLGVHAAHRNQGLAKAILVEGIKRLQELGAEQIFVETDNYRNAAMALYESVGFRLKHEVLVYRKDYAP
jgi:ribosomal protein S18 acetylase RimI-like enzyme